MRVLGDPSFLQHAINWRIFKSCIPGTNGLIDFDLGAEVPSSANGILTVTVILARVYHFSIVGQSEPQGSERSSSEVYFIRDQCDQMRCCFWKKQQLREIKSIQVLAQDAFFFTY